MHIFTKWSKHISWKIELVWFESSSNEQLHVNIKYDSHCQEVTSSYWLKKEIIFFFYREKTQSFSFLLFLNICLICKHTASTITFSKTIHCISCKKKSCRKSKSVCFFWFCVKYFISCLPQLYGWFLQKFLASSVAKFVASLHGGQAMW